MGWFDSDSKEKTESPADSPRPAPSTSSVAVPASAPRGAGSTVGKAMKIDGKIVSEEDLEILGRVGGTIEARQGLLIAREAEVTAVVNGRKVMVDGTLDGDLHATELVILGATSAVRGDIYTPSLEIREGALFQGTVKMKAAQAAVATKPAAKKAPGATANAGPPARAAKPAVPERPTAEKAAVNTASAKAAATPSAGS